MMPYSLSTTVQFFGRRPRVEELGNGWPRPGSLSEFLKTTVSGTH